MDRSTGLICDQTIVLTGTDSAHDYPLPLRRVSYRDPETGPKLDFLTNDFSLPARTIAELYPLRWQVEETLRYIKQSYRLEDIRRIYGIPEFHYYAIADGVQELCYGRPPPSKPVGSPSTGPEPELFPLGPLNNGESPARMPLTSAPCSPYVDTNDYVKRFRFLGAGRTDWTGGVGDAFTKEGGRAAGRG